MPMIPIDCDNEGDEGRGGSLDVKPADAKLVDEWLACERLGEASWPSSDGDTGPLAATGLLDAPRSRALLKSMVSFSGEETTHLDSVMGSHCQASR